jgi:hypothetical protein
MSFIVMENDKEGGANKPKKLFVVSRRKKKTEDDYSITKIVYDTDKLNVGFHQDRLCFQIYHTDLREQVLTFDAAEAVAAMMRIPKMLLDIEIWKIKLSEKDKEIQPIKAFYWMTGGNDEWVSLDNYSQNWRQASLFFEDKLGKELLRGVKKCTTLGDIRKLLERRFNLGRLYELALEEGFAR